MKLTSQEKETILLYNQAEPTADVYTYDRRLLRKLERLSVQNPDQIIKIDDHNYLVPKRCVTVRAPYSEERREAARQRAIARGLRPPGRRKA